MVLPLAVVPSQNATRTLCGRGSLKTPIATIELFEMQSLVFGRVHMLAGVFVLGTAPTNPAGKQVVTEISEGVVINGARNAHRAPFRVASRAGRAAPVRAAVLV